MKLSVVLIGVAVLVMFVFAEDTAAAITDSEDTKDEDLSFGLLKSLKSHMRFSSSSSGSSSKSSSKNPIYDLIKSVIKMLTKAFSDAEVAPPVIPGTQ